MRKLIASLILLTPFLVCKPYPTTGWQPTFFNLTFDTSTTPVVVQAVTNIDGSVQLKYDLSNISQGSHTVNVSAGTVWGTSNAVPFSFTRPSSPVDPQSIAIVP